MIASRGISRLCCACEMASFANLAPSSLFTGIAITTDAHNKKHKTTFILMSTSEELHDYYKIEVKKSLLCGYMVLDIKIYVFNIFI